MLLAVFWLIFPAAGCAWVIVTCGPCMVWALLAGTGLVPALLTVPVLVKFKLVKLVNRTDEEKHKGSVWR